MMEPFGDLGSIAANPWKAQSTEVEYVSFEFLMCAYCPEALLIHLILENLNRCLNYIILQQIFFGLKKKKSIKI